MHRISEILSFLIYRPALPLFFIFYFFIKLWSQNKHITIKQVYISTLHPTHLRIGLYTWHAWRGVIFFLIKFEFTYIPFYTQSLYSASQKKRKPVNQVNFSESCNDLSEKVFIVTKFSLSSFFWHQLQDVLVMHGRARTISNGDVKIDLAQNRKLRA